ncbi:unnamed protein product [Lactuca saligna]|uniref:Uncharacterized protein n=1 Tax=Lactuca saligna TaxID=75948 RepID=A0AA35Z3E0_LACSI|nr:unnamed protein product [Lactuca saligna]
MVVVAEELTHMCMSASPSPLFSSPIEGLHSSTAIHFSMDLSLFASFYFRLRRSTQRGIMTGVIAALFNIIHRNIHPSNFDAISTVTAMVIVDIGFLCSDCRPPRSGFKEIFGLKGSKMDLWNEYCGQTTGFKQLLVHERCA